MTFFSYNIELEKNVIDIYKFITFSSSRRLFVYFDINIYTYAYTYIHTYIYIYIHIYGIILDDKLKFDSNVQGMYKI